jgi:hypothetical protein
MCHKSKVTKVHSRVSAGTAGLATTSTTPTFPSIVVPPFPSGVLISVNRNVGHTSGSVSLNTTGITLGKAGDAPRSWWVAFRSVMSFTGSIAFLPINVLVVQDGKFVTDLTQANIVGGVGFLMPGVPASVTGEGPLLKIPGGTQLSLMATLPGSSSPVTITEYAWDIEVMEIVGSTGTTTSSFSCCCI